MERDQGLTRCLESLRPEAAAALLAGLKPADLKSLAARRLYDLWATASPSEAAAWAQSLTDEQTCHDFIHVAALRWAEKDLAAATAFARTLPASGLQAKILAAVAGEAVRSAPIEAISMAVQLPEGNAQTELVHRAAAEWGNTDPEGALHWAAQIEDERLREQVVGQIVLASAEKDPSGAANTALRKITPGEVQDRVLVSIIQRWVQVDPVATASWVADFPEGKLGNDAIENLVSLWAGQDPAATGNWLLAIPAGTLRNTGIRTYSHALRRTDATLADRWESSVTEFTEQ